MEGKKISEEVVLKLREEKDKAEEAKLVRGKKKGSCWRFLCAKKMCVFNEQRKMGRVWTRQCSVCSAIAKNSCGKAACKVANREVISPACETTGRAPKIIENLITRKNLHLV